ncbi:MAG: hypothetical protein LBE12_01755 [Planctomycetaceae bacterium]|nr:hypothetical protein [Planctomycetaceae bacterium]
MRHYQLSAINYQLKRALFSRGIRFVGRCSTLMFVAPLGPGLSQNKNNAEMLLFQFLNRQLPIKVRKKNYSTQL